MFGDILSELRKDKNLTQQDLALILNVSRSTLANWESGNNDIPIAQLVKIADYFNVSTDYLLGRTKYHKILEDELWENKEVMLQLHKLLKSYKITKK